MWKSLFIYIGTYFTMNGLYCYFYGYINRLNVVHIVSSVPLPM